MPETRLAHFDHHWEAELAQGYLDDAGVPSRLASDNLAGGHTYMGSVSGASLFVAPGQLDEARRVLASAGVLGTGPGGGGAPGDDAAGDLLPAARPLTPLQLAEKRDLEERLQAARKAEVRHFIRCMLGVTPTAVIPIVGLALEGEVALLALLCVLVVLVEGWRWIRAGRLVKEIQAGLARLEEAEDGGIADEEADGEGPGGGSHAPPLLPRPPGDHAGRRLGRSPLRPERDRPARAADPPRWRHPPRGGPTPGRAPPQPGRVLLPSPPPRPALRRLGRHPLRRPGQAEDGGALPPRARRLRGSGVWPGLDTGPLLDRFRAMRPALEDLYRSFEPLDRGTRDETLAYYGDVYEIVSTPERAQFRVFRDCKRLP